MDEPILVTGAAGFIGFHLSQRLLGEGRRVIGIDNLNPYYDVRLKKDRLSLLQGSPLFSFQEMDIGDSEGLLRLFESERPSLVVHLAAQAGVRYSLINPFAYLESNLKGFLNILEACRHHPVRHLVYASSSSVYGGNTHMPFSTHDNVDHPVSLYAATKKANELMAHSYAALYGMPVTGLRFFTVYGPWGRPDMALFLFTQAILEGRRSTFTTMGRCAGISLTSTISSKGRPGFGPYSRRQSPLGVRPARPGDELRPYRVYNIGNHQPVELMAFIEALEAHLGKKAQKRFLPLQPGDVPATYADVEDLMTDVGFKPCTSIEEGIGKFVAWYRTYYRP
jgi:UDP-glucuronate 4-epimerase